MRSDRIRDNNTPHSSNRSISATPCRGKYTIVTDHLWFVTNVLLDTRNTSSLDTTLPPVPRISLGRVRA
jgi:hypothetical protein